MIAYLDGAWVEEERALIPVTDRGFLLSDGVFETALLFDGAYLRLREHLDRLCASAATLGIDAPSPDTLTPIIREIANRNGLTEGSLRITVTSGSASRRSTVLVTIARRDPAWIAKAERGWKIITAATRRPSVAAVPSQLKALGRTYALLARREAVQAGVDDALLLTDAGIVCEGPSWNVFWRIDQTLHTPALEAGVLGGVTRSMLIDLAGGCGLTVQQGFFERAMLDRADEIFATMTSVGIVPIRQLDGRVLPPETPAAEALRARYWAAVGAYCATAEKVGRSV